MAKKTVNKNPPKTGNQKKPVRRKPRKPSPRKPTKKQEGFCHAYMETGNMSEAYRRVYNCDRMKPETINRAAKELFDNPKIATRIAKLKDKLKQVSDIKKERVLYELEAFMESKITDYVEIKDGRLVFKDFDKLTEQQIRAVESIKDTKYGIELKLHGKSWTTDRICKMLGYEAPKKFDHTSGGEPIKGGVHIIELPSNDREYRPDDEPSED